MFIGRENEVLKINKFLKESDFKASIIYGRRRVGKSELIKHAISNSNLPYLYYECKQTTEKNNVDSILEILGDIITLPPLNITTIENLLNYILTINFNKKLIIVLDEYPYLREVVQGLDSIIQSFIDNKKSNNVKLILCGSYIDVMKSLLDHENPLYGRFDLKMEIKPMNYYDSSKFYPSFSNEDKVRLYSVFGGIPYYNRLINSSLTVEENIMELIASDGARLENEISGFLKSQLTKINNANEVIEILAKGAYKYKDIYDYANIEKGPTLIDALDRLVSMDLIEKISPINDENNKKKTGYIIKDQLTHFYYKYVYRNKSRLKMLNAQMFYNIFIKEDFETQYVPFSFEIIAKEYLIRCNLNNNTNPFYKIGKYYYDDKINHKNGEFDIVTYDKNGYVFYEAKFKNKPLTNKDIDDEIKQVKDCGLDAYAYGFISKSGFDADIKGIIKISLDDIYR